MELRHEPGQPSARELTDLLGRERSPSLRVDPYAATEVSRDDRPTARSSKREGGDLPRSKRDIISRLNFYRGLRELFGEDAEAPRLGKYEVLELLGSGGHGVVLLGRNPDLDERVAIKVLRGGGGSTRRIRLLREARVLAKLKHPNIVPIHDAGEEGGERYIVMRWVQGAGSSNDGKPAGAPTLYEVQQGKSWRAIVDLYMAAGKGLAAVHAAGLVHRDFKADNVLVDQDGSVLLADFGLVCEVRSEEARQAPLLAALESSLIRGRLTGAGIVGTFVYMAPESFGGEPPSPRWDIYSFGVSLYEALYGERPYGGETWQALYLAAEEGKVPPRPADSKVPKWLDAMVRKAFAPKAEDRHASMAELLHELDYRRGDRRRRLMVGGIGVTVLGLLIGAGVREYLAEDPCRGDALAEIWNDGTRAPLAELGEDGGRLVGLLDAQADRWRGAHSRLCGTRPIQSSELYHSRMTCLEGYKDEFAAAIRQAASAGESAELDGLLVAAASLGDPQVCESATLTSRPTEEQRLVDNLTYEARAAAAKNRYIRLRPPADEPEATALGKILALEAVEGVASGRAKERARILRSEFAETLISLGDRLWEVSGARPFAIEYYLWARCFEPDNPRARERSVISDTEFDMFLINAVTGEF